MDAVADRLGIDRDRGAPAQSDRRGRDAVSPARSTRSATRSSRFRRLSAAARQGAGAVRLGRAAGGAEPPPRRRRDGRRAASRCSSRKAGSGPADGVQITVDTSGAVELVTGGASLGQGFETAMAQICAETLGVDYRRVRVVHGQTDRIEHGIGAHAARATVMTGGATHAAALKVRAKALEIASELLQTRPDELDIVDGVVRATRLRRRAHRSRLADIARASRPARRLLGGPRAGPGRRGLVPHRPHGLSLRRAARRGADRSRHRRRRRSSASWSPTTSAAPSIRCWSRASSSAASRRASAARCWRNSSTTRAASRSRDLRRLS